jgi:hypothetical protein
VLDEAAGSSSPEPPQAVSRRTAAAPATAERTREAGTRMAER